MKKERKSEKENILNTPNENANCDVGKDNMISNEDIEVIQYHGPVYCEESFAVTYGPSSAFVEELSSIEIEEAKCADLDDLIALDVDSNMYGGPMPQDFYVGDIDISDLSAELELLSDDDSIQEDENPDKISNQKEDL